MFAPPTVFSPPGPLKSLRLERVLPSNRPPHSDLVNALKHGHIANSSISIRAEILLSHGSHLPCISVGGDFTTCGGSAISSTLAITPQPASSPPARAPPPIDLNSEYDALLLQQSIEESVFMEDSPFTKMPTTPPKVNVNPSSDRVSIHVGEKKIIYLHLQEKQFTVHRSIIAIPRLGAEEIEAILGPQGVVPGSPPRKRLKLDLDTPEPSFDPSRFVEFMEDSCD